MFIGMESISTITTQLPSSLKIKEVWFENKNLHSTINWEATHTLENFSSCEMQWSERTD